MARKPRKEITVFSLSFMDCICCGFGAVILLLTLNRGMVRHVVEEQNEEEEQIIEKMEEEIFEIYGEITELELELNGVKQVKEEAEARLAETAQRRSRILGEFEQVPDFGLLVEETQEDLLAALQERDELRDTPPAWRVDSVGGIPADSRYIIFVIDVTGSMSNAAGKVLSNYQDILELYPMVEGIQVISDGGDYFDPAMAGKWYDGGVAGRREVYTLVHNVLKPQQQITMGAILNALRHGRPQGANDPMGGILRALLDYPQEEISIYVLGDDGPPEKSVVEIVRQADRLNPRDPTTGRRRVRIHALGMYTNDSGSHGMSEFATGMRFITNRYDGAFVGKY